MSYTRDLWQVRELSPGLTLQLRRSRARIGPDSGGEHDAHRTHPRQGPGGCANQPGRIARARLRHSMPDPCQVTHDSRSN